MEQPRSVHYVTRDAIQNLKIRIVCDRISAERSKANVLQIAPPGELQPQVLSPADPLWGGHEGQRLLSNDAPNQPPLFQQQPHLGPTSVPQQAPYDPYALSSGQDAYGQQHGLLGQYRASQPYVQQQPEFPCPQGQQRMAQLPPPFTQLLPERQQPSGLQQLLSRRPFTGGPLQPPHPVAVAQQQARLLELQRLEQEQIYGTPGVLQDPYSALQLPQRHYVEEFTQEELHEAQEQEGRGWPPLDREPLLKQQWGYEQQQRGRPWSMLNNGQSQPLGEALEDENWQQQQQQQQQQASTSYGGVQSDLIGTAGLQQHVSQHENLRQNAAWQHDPPHMQHQGDPQHQYHNTQQQVGDSQQQYQQQYPMQAEQFAADPLAWAALQQQQAQHVMPAQQHSYAPYPDVQPIQPAQPPVVIWPVERLFSWQEKVYSRLEVAQTQAAAAALPTGYTTAAEGLASMQQAAVLSPRLRRIVGFGSHQAIGQGLKPMEKGAVGSVLFSYTQTDGFVEQQEVAKRVTTSEYEQENHLLKKVLGNAKSRAQVLNFRSMYLMIDLGDVEHVAPGTNEKVLVSLKAYPDGSFDMTPGFSKPGLKYRFEDMHGGIYEYRVENASASAAPSLERRTAKLERAVAERAGELWRDGLRLEFQAPPVDHESQRLVLLAEIQACTGYDHDRLYIEYAVRFDPTLWDLQTVVPPQAEVGLLQGVTQVSRMVQYPNDLARDVEAHWVAHFAHPIELEWVSRGHLHSAAQYPSLSFQVCTYDLYNRYTCEGYGWLPLGSHAPAVRSHVVRTWRPLASARDQLQAFFIGGSQELEDITYLSTPAGFSGRVLNKYGFKTESVGAIKVRTNIIVQRFDPGVVPLAKAGRAGAAACKGADKPDSPEKRNRKELSLALVVERARMRLKDARGGDVMVRTGVLSDAPMIRIQPTNLVLPAGEVAEFKIFATGKEPLDHQWYKDGDSIDAATADSPNLILPDITAAESGVYHCKVSNKDGAIDSAHVTLQVQRQSRLAQAMGDQNRSPRSACDPAPPPVRGSLPALRVSRRQQAQSPRPSSNAGLGRDVPSLGALPIPLQLQPPPLGTAQQQQQQGHRALVVHERDPDAPPIPPLQLRPADGPSSAQSAELYDWVDPQDSYGPATSSAAHAPEGHGTQSVSRNTPSPQAEWTDRPTRPLSPLGPAATRRGGAPDAHVAPWPSSAAHGGDAHGHMDMEEIVEEELTQQQQYDEGDESDTGLVPAPPPPAGRKQQRQRPA